MYLRSIIMNLGVPVLYAIWHVFNLNWLNAFILRYRLCSKSSGRRNAAGLVAVFWAPTKSTLNPEIKIEAARKAMVRDLCRVFIIPRMKPHFYVAKSKVLQSSSSSSLVLDKILIREDKHEDEDEKYQIRSPESAFIWNYKASFSIRPAVFLPGGGAGPSERWRIKRPTRRQQAVVVFIWRFFIANLLRIY